jgi:hypothetical protein
MVVRQVESIIELARNDLCLFPSAMVVARAAFETGVSVIWLLTPTDPFEREVRWMAKLREYERAYRRLADTFSEAGLNMPDLSQRADSIKEFHQEILNAFPSGYAQIPGVPGTEKMLTELLFKAQNARYIYASQFVHAALMATEIYRPSIGGQALAEVISPRDWAVPLEMAWMSLAEPWRLFLLRTGGNSIGFPGPGLARQVRRAIESLRRN